MYRTVKGKRELVKWLKDNGYKKDITGSYWRSGVTTFDSEMFEFCRKKLRLKPSSIKASDFVSVGTNYPWEWMEGMFKPAKKLNSLEQLQKDYKELQEKHADLLQEYNELVSALGKSVGAKNKLTLDAVRDANKIDKLKAKVLKQADDYNILTGRHDALKDIVDRLIK